MAQNKKATNNAQNAQDANITLEELTDIPEEETTVTPKETPVTSPMPGFSAFRAAAKKATSSTDVIGDYRKYKGRDIAVTYPEGVYIADFDKITVRDRQTGIMKPVAVYNFSATPSGDVEGYTLGGSVINRLIDDWIEGIGQGDVTVTRKAYKASGQRVKIKISYGESSSGNPIQRVEVI